MNIKMTVDIEQSRSHRILLQILRIHVKKIKTKDVCSFVMEKLKKKYTYTLIFRNFNDKTTDNNLND